MKQNTTPRLWTDWQHVVFADGSVVVLSVDSQKPWLAVDSDLAIDEDRALLCRVLMSLEIASYLNGGERPVWLDDFERVATDGAVSLSGACICAIGPVVRQGSAWRTDGSNEAAAYRGLLIDALDLSTY